MYPLKIKEKYNRWNLEATAHRFSVVYLWTYIAWDFKEGNWSHPAVDIIPETKNQAVLSPLEGIVYKTWEDGAYGKYIIIEHTNVPHPDDMNKRTTLYSGFQHLSDIKVKEWQVVKEWEIVGNTGNTGNSFWEHLHFQIDRQEAPFHCYWPFSGAEAREAGTTFSWGVSIWLWKEKARMYTVNPLEYLDRVDEYRNGGNILAQNDILVEKKEEIKPEIQEKEALLETEKQVAKTWEIPLETLLTSNESDILIASNSFTQEKKEEIKPEIQEKKLDIIQSNEDIIVKNPILDTFVSQINDESQKKKFKDIKHSDALYEYISYLWEKWFISWFWDDTFRPNNSITRAEFLKLIFLISETKLSDDSTDYFTDIKVWWQKRYINTWVHLGMISTQNKKFNPNGSITRVEALKMILLLFIWELPHVYNKNLSDISGNEWFAKYVQYALENNFFSLHNSFFYPNKAITRYEVIYILKKITKI